jgi:hypothetical protein
MPLRPHGSAVRSTARRHCGPAPPAATQQRRLPRSARRGVSRPATDGSPTSSSPRVRFAVRGPDSSFSGRFPGWGGAPLGLPGCRRPPCGQARRNGQAIDHPPPSQQASRTRRCGERVPAACGRASAGNLPDGAASAVFSTTPACPRAAGSIGQRESLCAPASLQRDQRQDQVDLALGTGAGGRLLAIPRLLAPISRYRPSMAARRPSRVGPGAVSDIHAARERQGGHGDRRVSRLQRPRSAADIGRQGRHLRAGARAVTPRTRLHGRGRCARPAPERSAVPSLFFGAQRRLRNQSVAVVAG